MAASPDRRWLGARPPQRRAVHGRARHRNRQRRPALDQGRPRVLAGEPAVGDQRLRARVRRLPPARRARRGPARPQARLRRRPRRSSPAGSLVAGLAWSEASLIGARSLQGLGAAVISPAALSILMTTFREGRERNIALGVWGAVGMFGAAAGVLLGGIFTDLLSWEWIFFINVPVALGALALTPILLAESRDARRRRASMRSEPCSSRRASRLSVLRDHEGERLRLDVGEDDRPLRGWRPRFSPPSSPSSGARRTR